MAIDLDELAPRPKKPAIAIGEDLSALSVHELEARIQVFEDEIADGSMEKLDRPSSLDRPPEGVYQWRGLEQSFRQAFQL